VADSASSALLWRSGSGSRRTAGSRPRLVGGLSAVVSMDETEITQQGEAFTLFGTVDPETRHPVYASYCRIEVRNLRIAARREIRWIDALSKNGTCELRCPTVSVAPSRDTPRTPQFRGELAELDGRAPPIEVADGATDGHVFTPPGVTRIMGPQSVRNGIE